jgi:hypothetical protein
MAILTFGAWKTLLPVSNLGMKITFSDDPMTTKWREVEGVRISNRVRSKLNFSGSELITVKIAFNESGQPQYVLSGPEIYAEQAKALLFP